jgi:hypothetical protein
MPRKSKEAELRDALKTMCDYAKWQISEGGSYHPTLESALGRAEKLLSEAPEKSTYDVEIEGQSYEIEPCSFCGGLPKLKEGAFNSFGFLCTCGGKRYVHTYYDTSIQDRTGRIQSAVALWNSKAQ